MRILTVMALCCCALFLGACTGSSTGETLNPDKADSKEFAASPGQLEIAVGTNASRIKSVLGDPDRIETDDRGRQIWLYENRRAQYVYASNTDNVSALAIGGYAQSDNGLPLLLRLVIENGRMADFHFAQIGF